MIINIKDYVILAIVMLISTSIFAQKSTVHYLKNNGLKVELKDSADFIRIIKEPDSLNVYFTVLEFYPDNSRKFVGQVSSFEPKMIYEGASMLYNKNGKKSAQISYIKGIPFGHAYFFHANGRVSKVLDYNSEGAIKTDEHHRFDAFKVVSYFDSTGKEQVMDGNGYAILFDTDGISREEGRYSRGLKDSIWRGFYTEAGHYFEESYKDGILVSGIQNLPDGRKFKYSKVKEVVQMSGGREFNRFLQTNFKYPKEAIERNISGKMAINFKVKADGSVSDIKITPSLDFSMDREIFRIIRSTGKWVPAKLRGEPLNSVIVVGFGMRLSPTTIIRQESRQIPNGTPRLRNSF